MAIKFNKNRTKISAWVDAIAAAVKGKDTELALKLINDDSYYSLLEPELQERVDNLKKECEQTIKELKELDEKRRKNSIIEIENFVKYDREDFNLMKVEKMGDFLEDYGINLRQNEIDIFRYFFSSRRFDIFYKYQVCELMDYIIKNGTKIRHFNFVIYNNSFKKSFTTNPYDFTLITPFFEKVKELAYEKYFKNPSMLSYLYKNIENMCIRAYRFVPETTPIEFFNFMLETIIPDNLD
ncbi:MAG: hypothetical protein LBB39_01695 [Mycoplasmataceae bacterium]|jgi:hypothetical protein|nr:hypothetical protein [Mycoplasmataceae bacterium]